MKKIFLFINCYFLAFNFYACKSTADKKTELALENTKVFVTKWEQKERMHPISDEDHKQFTDDWNKLVLENSVQGVVKAKLSDEKIQEFKSIYSRARALKNKMILSEMQNGFLRRGSNSARPEVEIGSLNTDF